MQDALKDITASNVSLQKDVDSGNFEGSQLSGLLMQANERTAQLEQQLAIVSEELHEKEEELEQVTLQYQEQLNDQDDDENSSDEDRHSGQQTQMGQKTCRRQRFRWRRQRRRQWRWRRCRSWPRIIRASYSPGPPKASHRRWRRGLGRRV